MLGVWSSWKSEFLQKASETDWGAASIESVTAPMPSYPKQNRTKTNSIASNPILGAAW